MDFIKDKEKIYMLDENDKIIAMVEFTEVENGVYDIFHTFVDKSLRGQGIASKLVKEAVNVIKEKNGKITASCLYAKEWIKKNNIGQNKI